MTGGPVPRAVPARGLRVGVVCVLYGSAELPHIVADLSDVPEVSVAVVDNSGDLGDTSATGAVVVRPGRNLGYSAGVNRAVAELPDDLDVLLVVNPDIVSTVETMLDLARRAAAESGPALVAPHGPDRLFGFHPRQSVTTTIVQHTLRTKSWPKDKDQGQGFLSGALLAMNRPALRILGTGGHLLRDDLFFMDDVELSDRARRQGVSVREVPCRGTIQHVGGVSMRRRPAVRIYFSRVSKVRYWSGVYPGRARILAAYFLLEASIGWLVASRFRWRSALREGSIAGGFEAVLRWLVSRDGSIDEQVLGNT